MIPKIIHQVWVGPKTPPTRWMETWKEKHPGWAYILWDNNLLATYDFRNRDHIEKFMREGKYHGVADIVRYEAVYDFGGIAVPADSECLNSMDDLLDPDYDVFTTYENEKHYPGRLTPVIGASKRNDFLEHLVTGLLEKEEVEEPWIDTGNVFLTEIYEKFGKATVHPSWFFMPNHRLGGNWDGKGKPYALQYSGTTLGLYDKPDYTSLGGLRKIS